MLVATCECGFIARSRLAPDARAQDLEAQLSGHVCVRKDLRCPEGWDPLVWAKHLFPSCGWDADELADHMTDVVIEEMAHRLELWNNKQQRPKESVYVSRDGALVRLEPTKHKPKRSKSRVYQVG